jgi:Protein of unknown function (DUF2795)
MTQSLAGDGLGGDELGGPAGANAARLLEGARFPASRDDLVERAMERGAGQDLIEVLQSFPEGRSFESLAEVVRACGDSDQAPQTGVIDIKP